MSIIKSTKQEFSGYAVLHIGNTANNAMFNHLIFSQANSAVNSLGVFDWNHHAMSHPAWELLDFSTSDEFSLNTPNWSKVEGVSALESSTSFALIKDLPSSALKGTKKCRALLFETAQSGWIRFKQALVKTDLSALLSNDLLEKAVNWLGRKAHSSLTTSSLEVGSKITYEGRIVRITYGSRFSEESGAKRPIDVLLEHGTLRWIRVGSPREARDRERYKLRVSEADHVWVTNLDPQTLELAEDLASGKWSALPHPYVLSNDFNGSHKVNEAETRSQLLENLHSDFLIFLPSSINWSSHHNKGTDKALEAFIALRKMGHRVGLVCADWGLQVAEAKELLQKAGVSKHVKWIRPLPRRQLQRFMQEIDLVWDQFGLAAFGALAIRAMEAKVPLISHGLRQESIDLIGEAPKWLPANSQEEIISKTLQVMETTSTLGKLGSDSLYSHPQYDWLVRRHHQSLTLSIQQFRYESLIAGERGEAKPDNWARTPDFKIS